MGKGSAKKAEDQDDPMEGPPKKEESSSEELVPDDPGRAHKSATKVPRQFRAATHTAPPPATMAAYTDEAPVIPATDADGMHACPDCGKGLDSGVRWLLHRAANQESHSLRRFSQRLRVLASFVRTFVASGFALIGMECFSS